MGRSEAPALGQVGRMVSLTAWQPRGSTAWVHPLESRADTLQPGLLLRSPFFFFFNVISCTNRLKKHTRKPLFKKFSHFLEENENRRQTESDPPQGNLRTGLLRPGCP